MEVLQNIVILLQISLKKQKTNWELFKKIHDFAIRHYRNDKIIQSRVMDGCFRSLMENPMTPTLIKN